MGSFRQQAVSWRHVSISREVSTAMLSRTVWPASPSHAWLGSFEASLELRLHQESCPVLSSRQGGGSAPQRMQSRRVLRCHSCRALLDAIVV